ncbi:hypothetical protein EMCG_07388 [[Emmonsia] crescens]|uniref:Uncharacterized protein n=1 Tax=[Emmonsia] crescens TaxID=73230 RepID=A0A0G2I8G9_9EURO|nr:hypothetical protein EMCG_07388 [Emmonsia crescens UAMH 3008]
MLISCILIPQQKAKKRGDNPKKKCWFQKTMTKLWHPLSKKIPFINTIKEKRRERRVARGPHQPVPLPPDIEYIYARMTLCTLELYPRTDNDNDGGGERETLASGTSSVREDMFHLDGFDMLGNEGEFEVQTSTNWN